MNALVLGLALAAGPAAPVADIPLPKIESVVLDNGLKILAFENHQQPVFIARVAIPAGTTAEPVGKAGLAQFTASILTKGTSTRGPNDIIEWLDKHGAHLGASSDEDFTYVDAEGLVRDMNDMLALMADTLARPSFPAEEIDRFRPQFESGLRRAKDDPGALADLHQNYLLYGYGHPMGRAPSLLTAAAIDRGAIQAFYAARYRPNGSALILAGDFDARKAIEKVKEAFGGWQKRSSELKAAPALSPLAKTRVRIVNKEGSTQTQIRVAWAMPPKGNADHFANTVVNAALGVGFGSRLTAAIRAKEGKTYHISTHVEESVTLGEWNLNTFTRNAEVKDTVEKTLAIIEAMKKDGPTEDEVKRAWGLVGGSFVVRTSDMRALADALLDQDIYKLGDDYVKGYRRTVSAVTKDQAKAAAEKYLVPPAYVVSMVGNAKEIQDQVKALWPAAELEIRESADPVADEEKPKPVKLAPGDPVKGAAIFAAAVQAAGGEGALKKAECFAVDGMLTVFDEGQSQTIEYRQEAKDGGERMRQEMRIGGMKQVLVLTKDSAFGMGGGKVKDMPADMAAKQRGENLLEYPTLLRLPLKKELQLVYTGDVDFKDDEKKETTKLQIVELRTQKAGNLHTAAMIYFDAKTKLPFGFKRDSEPGKVEQVRFLEWKKQGDLQFPMKEVSMINGKKQQEVTVDKVEFAPIADDRFQKPK